MIKYDVVAPFGFTVKHFHISITECGVTSVLDDCYKSRMPTLYIYISKFIAMSVYTFSRISRNSLIARIEH